MAVLSAHGLLKAYNKRRVVNDVSLRVNSGEIVGLLGPNGAGKTTSFYMIAGLVQPDGGNIKIDNADITHMPMHARAKLGVGYLPQEPSVFRKLTVADNLRAVLQLRDDLTDGQQELLIEELLEEFHVGHLRNQKGIGLSGGERRRVEIARAWPASRSSSCWTNLSPASTPFRSSTSKHRLALGTTRHRHPHHRTQRAGNPQHL